MNDYASFPANVSLTGTLNDSNILYLIRDHETLMTGKGFKHDNHAIVKISRFTADSVGNTIFQIGDHYFTGKMNVNAALQEIELIIPDILDCNIISQKVNLTIKEILQSSVNCIERYKEQITYNIDAVSNILYGNALVFYTSKPIDYIKNDDYVNLFQEMYKAYTVAVMDLRQTQQELYLDIYKPENDPNTKRPVLLFIHGGAFFFGDKRNKIREYFTDYFVKRGYVVVSINYRLCSSLLRMGIGAVERTIYRSNSHIQFRYFQSCNESEMRVYRDSAFVCKGSAFIISQINNDVYYKQNGTELRLIFSRNWITEKFSNIILAPVERNYNIQITQRVYGGEQYRYELNSIDFFDYFSGPYERYFGIESVEKDILAGTLIFADKNTSSIHIAFVSISLWDLFNGGTMKIQLDTNIPQHNVETIFSRNKKRESNC